MDAALETQVQRWIAADPSPDTQAELRALLAKGDDASRAELADRFAGTLEFGTAGLRGVLGGGPNRMNRAVVLTTTYGLATHLAATFPDAKKRGVVIGYDGRHMSREFAEDTAGVLTALGFVTHLFVDLAPTPLTAFAVHALGAAAGVMVTASHNPPEYNGYKVYWENAAQIIPPIDGLIAKAIATAPAAKDVPRHTIAEGRAAGLLHDAGAPMERAYLNAIAKLRPEGAPTRALRIVYTPMHGVGNRLTRQAMAEAGFTDVTSVPEQAEPDGAFPTVAFPNPEEKGAMDLSFALARKLGAQLVLANDPDADRLAVAVPSAASATGFQQLTGNQVGVLLGHYLLTREAAKDKRVTIASIVSSPMLGVIARALGVRYEETLTGFKWIANRAMELEKDGGWRFVFGYEEALGYTVGDVVRDKDGISAALVFSELAAKLAAEGRTVQAELEAICRKFGLFVSSQVNVTRKGKEGAAEIAALMDRLRAATVSQIGPLKVLAISDYAARKRRVTGGATTDLALPKTNMVVFELEGSSRVIARPSGTEPKVKLYVDVREDVKDGEAFDAAEKRAAAAMQAVSDAFVKLAGV